MRAFRVLLITAVCFLLLFSCGRDTPLSEFVPKSDDERKIKEFFMAFQNGVNARDAGKVESLIHQDASFIIGRERKEYSRKEYIKILPKRLRENPPVFFGVPRIDITGDQARVRLYMTRGSVRALITYDLRLEAGQWRLLRWDY